MTSSWSIERTQYFFAAFAAFAFHGGFSYPETLLTVPGGQTMSDTAPIYGTSSLIGRTSTLPMRAGGICDANRMASSRSLASIR
jgi:hypothetical protein